MLPQLESIRTIAVALQGIPQRFVFVGAGILPLLLDEEHRASTRPTVDTDVVVSVLHYSEWSRLRDELVAHGFIERMGQRQTLFYLGELEVDFIPARMKHGFGTDDHWLSMGIDRAQSSELPDGTEILHLTADTWLAAKLAAFADRGRTDPWVSKDLEDITTLLSGRESLVDEVRNSHPELRKFVALQFQEWRRDATIMNILDGSGGSLNLPDMLRSLSE